MKLYYHDRMYYRPGTQPKGAEKVDVPTDAIGLVDYLNGYGTGVSTRQRPAVADLVGSKVDTGDTGDIPETFEAWFQGAKLRIPDEIFERQPLSLQLHQAALAVENARERIKPAATISECFGRAAAELEG